MPDADDSRPGGLPKPGTLEHTVTLGLFRLQQGLNQAALKLQAGPESLLQEGYSLLTGQQVCFYSNLLIEMELHMYTGGHRQDRPGRGG